MKTTTYVPFACHCPDCGAPMACAGAQHESETCKSAGGFVPTGHVERHIWKSIALYPLVYGRGPWSRWRVLGGTLLNGGFDFDQDGKLLVDYNFTESHINMPLEGIHWMSAAENFDNDPRYQAIFRDDVASAHKIRKIAVQLGVEDQYPIPLREDRISEIAAQWHEAGFTCPKKFTWFGSEHATIKNMPENADLDWVAAAYDVLHMMRYMQQDVMEANNILHYLGLKFPNEKPKFVSAQVLPSSEDSLFVTLGIPYQGGLARWYVRREAVLSYVNQFKSALLPDGSIRVKANVDTPNEANLYVRLIKF